MTFIRICSECGQPFETSLSVVTACMDCMSKAMDAVTEDDIAAVIAGIFRATEGGIDED